MELKSSQIDAFAQWSGDHNPLHVDSEYARRTFFGRPLAHGVLCVVEAMRNIAHGCKPPVGLEVEFRHGVFPGERLSVTEGDGEYRIRRGNETVLTLRMTDGSSDLSSEWQHLGTVDAPSSPIAPSSLRNGPREWDVTELADGLIIHGDYPRRPVPVEYLQESCL
jgi:hypothetical protein